MNQTIKITSLWKTAFESSIISVSGWRFCVQDAEDDRAGSCSPGITQLVYCIAYGYAQYALHKNLRTICLGRDTRPSGEYIQKIVQSVLSEMNIAIHPLGIIPSPELSNYVQVRQEIDAYLYISASHNPIGYNGFKFGDSSGGVNDAQNLELLLSRIHAAADHLLNQTIELRLPHFQDLCDSALKQTSEQLYQNRLETFFLTAPHARASLHDKPFSNHHLHMVLDFNGSARFHSIDLAWMKLLNSSVHPLNEKEIVHAIIPEGSSLQDAAIKLDQLHQTQPNALYAYVYDCDGDRGNLVLHDGTESLHIDAQTHFALLVTAILEHRNDEKNLALVVNGPTSFRIDAIADRYNVTVFRTEVGEKNVLEGIEQAQRAGKTVVFAGEGSNGGAILPGVRIRDPLVAMTTISLYLHQKLEEQRALASQSRSDNIISDILHQLPNYLTTVSSDESACLRLARCDALALRTAFKRCFETWWEKEQNTLQQHYTITQYAAQLHAGSASYDTWFCDNNAPLRGGLSIILSNEHQEFVARMWFRASGTEPLYRILIDLPQKDGQSHSLYEKLFTALSALLGEAIHQVETKS